MTNIHKNKGINVLKNMMPSPIDQNDEQTYESPKDSRFRNRFRFCFRPSLTKPASSTVEQSIIDGTTCGGPVSPMVSGSIPFTTEQLLEKEKAPLVYPQSFATDIDVLSNDSTAGSEPVLPAVAVDLQVEPIQSSRLIRLLETMTPPSTQDDLQPENDVHPNVSPPLALVAAASVEATSSEKEWQTVSGEISESISAGLSSAEPLQRNPTCSTAEMMRLVGSPQLQSTPVSSLLRRHQSWSRATMGVASADDYKRLCLLTMIDPLQIRYRTELVDSGSRPWSQRASSSMPLGSDHHCSLRPVATPRNATATESQVAVCTKRSSVTEMADKNDLTAVMTTAINHPNTLRSSNGASWSTGSSRRRRLYNIPSAGANIDADLEVRELSDGDDADTEVQTDSHKIHRSQKPPPSLIYSNIRARSALDSMEVSNLSLTGKPGSANKPDKIEGRVSKNGDKNLPKRSGRLNSKRTKIRKKRITGSTGNKSSGRSYSCEVALRSPIVSEPKIDSIGVCSGGRLTRITGKTTKRHILESIDDVSFPANDGPSTPVKHCFDRSEFNSLNDGGDFADSSEKRNRCNYICENNPAKKSVIIPATSSTVVRRSKRVRCPRLNLLIGEKAVYEWDLPTRSQSLVGIEAWKPRQHTGEWNPTRKHKRSSNELDKNRSEQLNQKKEKRDGRLNRQSMHVSPGELVGVSGIEPEVHDEPDHSIIVKQPITGDEITVVCIARARNAIRTNRFGNSASDDDQVLYSKTITGDGFVAGRVYLRPFATLEEETVSPNFTTIYSVLKGKMVLQLNGKGHLLEEGDNFQVLPGNLHSLKNTTCDEATLSYNKVFSSSNVDVQLSSRDSLIPAEGIDDPG